ncbi:GM22651 [Drosophila sechellia]|uniref:GM22651 n=1 Tax=Drosophila sechellia TaxID=7238 RepID=B4I6C0_DROSE|nr:GM22651 [Drosophila sechellia]
MAKKFCYSEKKTLARIEKKQNHRKVPDSQFENGQDAEEEDGDGSKAMGPEMAPQKLGVLKNLANGYLKLVHEIEANLCLPAPPMGEAKSEREVGGEIAQNTEIEEDISQSSEDTTYPGIGFVNLYRRSTHFECLGIPLTSLELFCMERQRNAGTEASDSLKSLDERLIDSCSETTKPRCHIDFRNVGGQKSSRFKEKTRNAMINESKLFPSSSICGPEDESKHGGSWPNAAKPSALETHLYSSDSEMFEGSHAPNPVESSSMKVSGKRLEELMNCKPDKLRLKKSISTIVESDFEPLEPMSSNDTFTEAWMNSNLNRVPNQQNPRIGGLYRRSEKLKFQPIDRLDAGCVGLPLFKNSEESLKRTQYFVTEFDKLSHADKVQDIELRMDQLRWLHATTDHEYRQHFRKQSIPFKKVLTNSVQYACPLNYDECPAVKNDTLLAHFICWHLDEPGKELREIFEGEQVLMVFTPRAFRLGKTECLSVLVYGGVRNKSCTLPGVRFMPTPNTGLPEAYDHFDGHLPLLLMICRNRTGTAKGRKVRFEGLEDEETLALWMASRDLPCPIHVAMTVLSRRLDVTRSSIMKVRELHKSQDPLDFMLSNKNHMRLSNHDLRVFTNDHREPIYLEVVVKEYAGIT